MVQRLAAGGAWGARGRAHIRDRPNHRCVNGDIGGLQRPAFSGQTAANQRDPASPHRRRLLPNVESFALDGVGEVYPRNRERYPFFGASRWFAQEAVDLQYTRDRWPPWRTGVELDPH